MISKRPNGKTSVPLNNIKQKEKKREKFVVRGCDPKGKMRRGVRWRVERLRKMAQEKESVGCFVCELQGQNYNYYTKKVAF